MNAWSAYLRGQAVMADRLSETMTTPEARKEFADIASSFRRDADRDDETPPLPQGPRSATETTHRICTVATMRSD
jgi:hypothetical protein